MSKRGQVTIFIILGIIILATLSLLYFAKIQTVQKITTTSSESQKMAVQNLVEKCLDDLTHQAIFFVSGQGGYYKPPIPYYEHYFFKIPYYYNQKKINIPQKQTIELELSSYIQENIPLCLEGIKQFPFNITSGNINVKTTINQKSITTFLEYPLIFKIGNTITELKNFQINAPVELDQAIQLTQQIIIEQENIPNVIPFDYLINLSEEKNISIDLLGNNGTVLYIIKFPHSKYNNNWYVFTYAVKYSWKNITPQNITISPDENIDDIIVEDDTI